MSLNNSRRMTYFSLKLLKTSKEKINKKKNRKYFCPMVLICRELVRIIKNNKKKSFRALSVVNLR